MPGKRSTRFVVDVHTLVGMLRRLQEAKGWDALTANDLACQAFHWPANDMERTVNGMTDRMIVDRLNWACDEGILRARRQPGKPTYYSFGGDDGS